MINFIEKISDYFKRKDHADMAIHAWKSAHEESYADFCKRMDAVGKGNLSVLMDIYQMMRDCTPSEALMLYNWLSDFMNGKDVQNIADQQWAGRYTDIIAQCITNKRLWIGINVKTGTVELLTSPKSELLMVRSETPIEIWNRLPQETRAYLTGQLDVLIRNSKGCYLMSKLERKMVYQSLTYILRIIILSHAVFVGGLMANLYDYVMEKKETLAYCMYYFVVFDHGLSRMAKLLDCLLNNGEVDNGDMILIKSCVAALVTQSIEMGTESKAGWEDAVETCNPEIWKEFLDLKERGKLKKIGFSLYSPSELEILLTDDVPFDLVQFPYNVFDRQFEPYLELLHKRGVEIHVRSTFLQGVFFMVRERLPEKLKPLAPYLTKLDDYAQATDMTVAEVALNFNLQNPFIDGVLIGVDSVGQLQDNLRNISERKVELSIDVKEKELLNPGDWK